MKVTLIRAPLTLSKYASAAPAVPPIGLAYIASSLITAGHFVSVVDGIGEGINDYIPFDANTLYRGLTIEQIILRCDESDVFGISVMFSQDWPLAKLLIKQVRCKYPESYIIAGGEHVTAEPVGALDDCPELDFVVIGEGDYVLPELLDTLKSKGNVAEVASIYYRSDSGAVMSYAKRDRNKILDKLPWPAWDLFPMENYLAEGHGWGVNRGRSMPIIASRGCPYQCTFCSNPNMWTTRWVVRSVDEVVNEIRYYIKKYQATNFDFQDLTAIVKKQWIKTFCQKLIDENINITWQLPTGTRTEAIDEEVANLLFKAGCKNISYAPESASPEVLKRIKKKISPEDVFNSARGCIYAGLDVKFNFIFGFPEDRYGNLFESMRFIVRLAYLGVSDISIAPFSPYPGSELFYKLQRDGKIPSKLDDKYYKQIPFSDMSSTVSWCENVPSRSLNFMRNIAMILFYVVSWTTHPSRPFRRAYNFYHGIEESRMDKAFGDIKRRNKNLNKTL